MIRRGSFAWFKLGMGLATAVSAVAQSTPPPLSPGLLATATDGRRTVVFVMPTPDFTLAPGESIHPQLRPRFQVEWTGYLRVAEAGAYTFSGNAQIYLARKKVSGDPLPLAPGNIPLRVVYARKDNRLARFQLRWSSSQFRDEPIPYWAFGHRAHPRALEQTRHLERGRRLVEDLGCTACHTTSSPLLQPRPCPDLTNLGERLSSFWVFHWLKDPHHFDRGNRMPRMAFRVQDRADVAAYLATLKRPSARGPTRQPSAAQIARGSELFRSIGCLACHGAGAVSLDGIGSKYSFESLARYLKDPLAVDPSGQMPDFQLSNAEATSLAAYLVQSRNPDWERAVRVGDPLRGKALVSVSGCLNCHRLENPRSPIKDRLRAPPFRRLAGEKGCLAPKPPAKAPHYDLSEEDRACLVAFLAHPDPSKAPLQDSGRLLARYNCRACHDLEGPAILSFAPGQNPPSLTEAGEKYRATWLEGVLLHGDRSRPWMKTRMPDYGARNLKPLIKGLASRAGAPFGDGPPFPQATEDELRTGTRLLGRDAGGAACINCHDFRGQPSTGEMRGFDLTQIHEQLRVGWLRRWLQNPRRLQPETLMPAPFTITPSARTRHLTDCLVATLALGRKIPAPPGLDEPAHAYLLLVHDKPVIFRAPIQGSSSRSIAVGLPGLLNYCFDTETCELRYAWTGDFLDIDPVWESEKDAPARILGPKFYTAPRACPIHIGKHTGKPKVHFEGYRLVNRMPEFRYRVNGKPVEEFVHPTASGQGLIRTFEIQAGGQPVWFIAGQNTGANLTCSGGPIKNGEVRLPSAAIVRFDVRILPR